MTESSRRSATGADGTDVRPAVHDAPPGGPVPWYRHERVPRLVFPIVLVLAWVVLTCIGLSGTSIGVVAAGTTGASHDGHLVAGTPRPIRSDEWNVATPLIVAQSHHGFSRYTVSGLGPHDLTVVLDIPNRDWSTAFRPWDVPMLLLDVTHGFAARWWAMSLVLLLGAYLLLLELTDRTDIAVLFSLGLWLSPFFHWWYESISLESVGMPMLGLAFLLWALRARTRPGRIACLLLSAYSFVGFVLVFYPPFQVPVGLVLGIIVGCEIFGRVRRGELGWRRLVVDVVVVGAATGAVCAAFLLHSESTIAAVTGTVYPGERRAAGGTTTLFQLFSAPFGVPLANHGLSLTGTNQSEISSFLLLGPFALLQLFRIRLRDVGSRWRLLLVGAGAGFLLVTAWYLVSLPPLLAHFLLLDRSPPVRSIAGVGVGGFLLMALFCAAEVAPADGSGDATGRAARHQREFARRVATGAAVCGVLAFGMYFWAGRLFITTFPPLGMTLWGVALFSGAAAVVVWLTSARRVLAGGIALVVFGSVVSLVANPLYQGLGPLTSSPLLPVLHSVARHPADPADTVWVSYAPPPVNDVLLASGLDTLNSVDTYPNADVWKIFDPERRAAGIWNRYANLVFAPGAPGSSPVITLLAGDAVQVTFDPCGPEAARLHVGFVLSPAPVAGSCLHLEARPTVFRQPLYVYSRSSS
jgi:hypothetical protein